MIRVQLPFHLQTLAQSAAEIVVELDQPATPQTLIQALELKFPTLRGVILDRQSGKRRPLVRFFACRQDISHDAMDKPLPQEIVEGKEPFMIVGAIAGG